MKTNQSNREISSEIEVKQDSSSVEMAWSQQAYHEMADVPVVQLDLLGQFNAQLKQLEELQARTAFVMREVTYLMKV